jgi:hypothetical protein
MRQIVESRLFFHLKYATHFQRCIALLVTLLIIVYGLLIPTARNDLKLLADKPTVKNAPKQIALPTENQKAHSFYQQLPNEIQVKEILAQFYSEAEVSNVDVSTVQYSLEETADVSFAAYKLSAPIFGEYLDMMQLVKIMLETYPTLALKQLRLIREDRKDNLVSAELEFVIYMQKDN